MPLEFIDYLPQRLRPVLCSCPLIKRAEEIRLGLFRPLLIFAGGKINVISESGEPVSDLSGALIITRELLHEVLNLICRGSVYSAQEQLKCGFVTLPGGHRAGVSGSMVCEGGVIKHIKDISSINIRIAHQIKGCADRLMPHIVSGGRISNTLIISPPQCGKTTVLRDIARQLGGGRYMFKVSVIDERGEIAACYDGCAQNDIGYLTDVFDNCPKAEGILMALRSMSPDVIITDEIGSSEDFALFRLVNAGVKIICSAHGYDRRDVERRIGGLIKLFDKIIVLSRRNGPGTIEGIGDINDF